MKKITILLFFSIIFSSCILNKKIEITIEPTFEIKEKNTEKDILTGSILEKKIIEKKEENISYFNNKKWFSLLEEKYLKLDLQVDWENKKYSKLLEIWGGKGLIFKEKYFVFHNIAGLYFYDIEKNILEENSYPYKNSDWTDLKMEKERGYVKLESYQWGDGSSKTTYQYGKYFPEKNESILYLTCLGQKGKEDTCKNINEVFGKKINNSNLIEKYYNNIQEGDLEKAYNMKYKPNISLEKFKKQYSISRNTKITLLNIKENQNNKYIFIVDIFHEQKGLEKYETSMQVIDGKLKTLSVENKIEKEILEKSSYGNMTAYIEGVKLTEELKPQRSKIYSKLYLEIRGRLSLIDYSSYGEVDDIISQGNKFSELKFIKKGEILEYRFGRFGFSTKVFNFIKSGNKINSGGMWSIFGLTKNEKYLYICGIHGIGGGWEYKIYNSENGELIKDMSKDLGVNLNDKNPIENCSKYDEEKNILFFERHNGEKYEYNFNTNKIIKK